MFPGVAFEIFIPLPSDLSFLNLFVVLVVSWV